MKSRHLLFGGLTLFLMVCACGGGSDSSGSTTSTLSLQATVALPSSGASSLTVAPGLRAVGLTQAAVTETNTSGVACHAEDASGATIGTGCTTGADGACNITGLTSEQILDGVVIVADNGTAPIHAYEQPTEEDLTAAEAAGTPLGVTVNTESDLAYAVVANACNGDLTACQATVDPGCLAEATRAVVGDDDPSTDNLGGYAEALFNAHAAAITNATPGQNPASFVQNALGGNAADFTAVAGATISSVPVTDAITQFGTMLTTLQQAYCNRTSGTAPWETVRSEGGANFDPRAMVGVFKEFTSSELGSYEAEDFRGFATNLPNLDGGFQMFGAHSEARRTLAEHFRLGAFADPARAGPALGFMSSTFPPCTTPDTCRAIAFGGSFDPSVAARAAHNGFLDYVGSAETANFARPRDIYTQFNTIFSDATHRQAFASGGTSAFGTLISGFVSAPGTFRPEDHLGGIKAPPGAACTSNDDCLPCDSCVSSVCTSLSTKMGTSCTSNSDCDDITTCVGGMIAARGGQCMCTAGVPTGAFVHQGPGSGPVSYGTAGGFAPPTQGGLGAPCTILSDCAPPLSCSSSTGGVCINNSTFKKGPFAPCSANSECESNTCSSGQCGFSASLAGGRTIGQPCASPAECASFFCSAGVCAAPPTAFQGATGGAGLKSDGSSCTLPSECASFFCAGGVCTAPTGGSGGGFIPPTNLPAGAFCMGNAECQSLHCNSSTHQCS